MNTAPHGARTARTRLALLLALLAPACGDDAPDGAAAVAPPAPTVVVADVEVRDVPVVRDFVARTEAVETVEVQARVEAILEEMAFEEGRTVEEGQILYRLDDDTYQAELAAAEARLEQARANLKLANEQVSVRAAEAALVQSQAKLKKAEQDVARLRPLAEKDAVPRQDLDTALAAEEVARAEVKEREATLKNAKIQEEVGILLADADVKSAESALALAQLDLDYCTIAAPLDGLIGRTQVDVGNLVGRGDATVLATVSSVDPIYVTFAISEAEYLVFQARREGRAEQEGGAEDRDAPIQLILADDSLYAHQGHVVSADRAVAEETGTLQLVAEFPNPDGFLRPGQFGRARIQVALREDALLVPQRAVMEQQSTKVVLIVDAENRVAQRSVQITDRFEDRFVVAQGLAAGDRVIVEGQLKARPGLTVVPTDRPLTTEPGEAESATTGGAGEDG
jgi:membrane fusion protein (multidrug efflux system)